MSLFDDDLPPPRPRRSARTGPAERAKPEETRPAPPPQPRPDGPPVVSVSRLTGAIARRLNELGRVAVEGEVSAPKEARSGHLYFGLKDEEARLDCKVWRSRVRDAVRFRLEEGARVVCHGRLDVYAPRGTYSLIVERIERRGLGELLARLEELRAELRSLGWFDRARPLPPMPRRVGVVTSRDADAWRDFLRTRSLRWPGYPVRLVHTRVQGPGAAAEIAAAIRRLDASGVDVLCLVRGGGSLEDLWAFNERAVAEAIHAASVPVVTGVGHQSDTTLADHVADHRAHTPTDAAQTVLPDRAALLERLERTGGYLVEAMTRQLERRLERLQRIEERRTLREAGWILERRFEQVRGVARALQAAGARRLETARARLEPCATRLATQSPGRRLERLESRLAGLAPRLTAAATAPLTDRARRLELAGRALESVSPFAVLQRGYSITRRADGRAARDAGELRAGERIESVLAEGVVRSEVLPDEDGGEADET